MPRALRTLLLGGVTVVNDDTILAKARASSALLRTHAQTLWFVLKGFVHVKHSLSHNYYMTSDGGVPWRIDISEQASFIPGLVCHGFG